MSLGGGPGSFEQLHDLIVDAFLEGTDGKAVLSQNFLREVERSQPFDTNPIYALLHESIYINGPGNSSNWAAHRSLSSHSCSEQFNFEARSESKQVNEPVLFFGEMVFPFMVEDYEELKGLGDVAQHLASRRDWSELYGTVKNDLDGKCGGACAIYFDDMYVDRELSLKALDDSLPGVKVSRSESRRMIRKNMSNLPHRPTQPWITNEYQHSGLRDSGALIFKTLLDKSKN